MAALAGTLAFLALVTVCQLVALVGFLQIGTYRLLSWAKIGLLTALVSLRAEVVATAQALPFSSAAATFQVRFLPMVLTLGFLWLAARAGRRAARGRWDSTPLVTTALAAAGAGTAVAALAAVASALVTLSLPDLGSRLRVDVGSAALWAGVLAAAGAGIGAYLEASRGRTVAAALRGGLAGYAWALVLLTAGVLMVATVAPRVTRAYADGLGELGTGGAILFGYHVLALPTQSALLFAPASGSCLEVLADGPALRLCPWRIVASGPAGRILFPYPVSLSPWLWLLNAVPAIASVLAGLRAVTPTAAWGRRAIGLGLVAGLSFATLTVVGAWFASPGLVGPRPLPVSEVSLHPRWPLTVAIALAWGIVGGVIGGWIAARRYGEPWLPRPTSV